jgi:hypothetical protein
MNEIEKRIADIESLITQVKDTYDRLLDIKISLAELDEEGYYDIE